MPWFLGATRPQGGRAGMATTAFAPRHKWDRAFFLLFVLATWIAVSSSVHHSAFWPGLVHTLVGL
jgi:hypothetical protein